jgi:hypothetical protein
VLPDLPGPWIYCLRENTGRMNITQNLRCCWDTENTEATRPERRENQRLEAQTEHSTAEYMSRDKGELVPAENQIPRVATGYPGRAINRREREPFSGRDAPGAGLGRPEPRSRTGRAKSLTQKSKTEKSSRRISRRSTRKRISHIQMRTREEKRRHHTRYKN